MVHGVKTGKLGRKTSHRISMLENLATCLFTHGELSTTLGRAKELKPFSEKLITIAKRGDAKMNVIRQLSRFLHTEVAVRKCMEYAELFSKRSGGYTRVLKNGYRYGDNAPIGFVQMVEKIEEVQTA